MIGRSLGIDALAIFYIVEVPVAFTDTIISALLETVSTLGGQSIGVGSYKLTGQYCQISIIMVSTMLNSLVVFLLLCWGKRVET
jgi:Na+-driven multidrug efflux pump